MIKTISLIVLLALPIAVGCLAAWACSANSYARPFGSSDASYFAIIAVSGWLALYRYNFSTSKGNPARKIRPGKAILFAILSAAYQCIMLRWLTSLYISSLIVAPVVLTIFYGLLNACLKLPFKKVSVYLIVMVIMLLMPFVFDFRSDIRSASPLLSIMDNPYFFWSMAPCSIVALHRLSN